MFSKLLRCMCTCVVMQKGSWTPNQAFQKTEKHNKRLQEPRPEWLKQWTISKGWMHNRSHLLNLGIENETRQDLVRSDSSISLEDVDELVSLDDVDKIEIVSEPEVKQDVSMVFMQVSKNYRKSFPDGSTKNSCNDLELPEIYKERILMSKKGNSNLINELWRHFKPKRKSKVPRNCRFTVNSLYDATDFDVKDANNEVDDIKPALFNKTNLLDDTIYECSEDSVSLYQNPLYSTSPSQFFGFQSNHVYKSNNFSSQRTKLAKSKGTKFDSIKYRMKTEKYIIRHIKVRIMLSMKLGRFQKRRLQKRLVCGEGECQNDVVENDSMRLRITKTHEEQRRIGNGRTSLKIQNMRYGRLNVLRWLLWEAQSRADMPALEKATSTTLALHYAAARGCLDCVRLLVDSTPELSANTQMDNDVTPVYLAAQEGHLDVLKFLVLEAGGSLYVRAKDGMAPIHAASQMGCLNCVKWMIQDQGVDPNLRDGDGATPLHFAASRGHLETVRWLLKHGARLSLDKYGKSPINDAAENQQVECLNVLVQHGTVPDYKENGKQFSKPDCSCTRRTEKVKRSNTLSSDCSACKTRQNNASNQEPFYLHPPLGPKAPPEAPHAPQDGLYINPMSNQRHSTSTSSDTSSVASTINGESFYLHNPEEVIYNRVKDLFEKNNKQQSLSALTVKVEVHSSSSGAGSDENLSSSDLSERSGDHDHDYEDIYLVREDSENKPPGKTPRSRSRDSGSHSRSGSASSTNSRCDVVVNEPERQKAEEAVVGEEQEKPKLDVRHSLPSGGGNSRLLKRVTSAPVDSPPPPPPPPPAQNRVEVDDEPRGADIVEVVEEPTIRPSQVVKSMCRSISALSSKRLNSSCSDLTIVSLDETVVADRCGGPNLVNKQRVLPFVPPSFPGGGADSNQLIKPSEYLRSISGDRRTRKSSGQEDDVAVAVTEEKQPPPPPPPPEPASDAARSEAEAAEKKRQQPLGAISIQDLNSVQLRRTDKMVASKTFSAPTRSTSLQSLQGEAFLAQKTDLIAELKLSRDITGIRKMKIERAKVEECKEKEIISEITKQFTVTHFVEKIPDKDNTGNIIPAWKRQMLAKKAAEKARKELEEQLQREAEQKRLEAIPQWKRQLLAKKEEAEQRIRSTIYTPKVVEDSKVHKMLEANELQNRQNDKENEDINNNKESMTSGYNTPATFVSDNGNQSSDEEQNIIPWRAHLRKTNSKLNLLD